MKKFLLSFLLLLLFLSKLFAQQGKPDFTFKPFVIEPCANLDFEECSFNMWELYSGDVPGTSPYSFVNAAAILPGTQHFIESGGYDSVLLASNPPAYLPKVFPEGSFCSALLGDSTGVGAKGARLKQTFLLDSINSTLVFSYAVVSQLPSSHTANDVPYFSIHVYDADSNYILCGNFDVNGLPASSGGDPSFITTSYNGESVGYKNWTTHFIDLSNYVNQNISIEFTSGDCGQGGHFGYAYVDGACKASEMENAITVSYGSNCSFPASLHAISGVVSYLWNTGQTTQDIVIDSAGVYSVTVTSSTGCSAVFTKDIQNLTPPIIQQLSICNGDSVFLQGSYQSSSGTYYDTLQTVNGCDSIIETILSVNQYATSSQQLSICSGDSVFLQGNYQTTSGTYYDSLQTMNGCDSIVETNLIVNPSPTDSISFSNITCNAVCDGYASAIVTNIPSPIAYSWSNEQVNQTITGLCPGTYYVTMTTNNLCTKVDSVIISEPETLGIAVFSTPDHCGLATGTATANANGGTSTYTYLWSDSQTTQTATGLLPGIYLITVTDSNGCTDTTVTTVEPDMELSPVVISNNPGCFGVCDGASQFIVPGLIPPTIYVWSNGDSSAIADSLCTGTYTVTATDSLGCAVTSIATISEPSALSLSGLSTPDSGNASGTAGVSASGGTPPYFYYWETGDTLSSVSGLPSSVYFITVTDANGCTTADSVFVDFYVGVPFQISSASGGQISIIPNPNKGEFMVQITNQNRATEYRLQIFNMLGEIVYQSAVNSRQSAVAIDIHKSGSGVYYVQVQSGQSLLIQKILIR